MSKIGVAPKLLIEVPRPEGALFMGMILGKEKI